MILSSRQQTFLNVNVWVLPDFYEFVISKYIVILLTTISALNPRKERLAQCLPTYLQFLVHRFWYLQVLVNSKSKCSSELDRRSNTSNCTNVQQQCSSASNETEALHFLTKSFEDGKREAPHISEPWCV